MRPARANTWDETHDAPLDMLDLIRAGNFDARTAALCWMATERHGSLIVAGQLQGAGKTTTLDAFVECLPTTIARIRLQGTSETFGWLPDATPASTFLYAAEISAHLPMYIWGPRARKAIALIGEGFALGATLHADSVEETLGVLVDELGAAPADVARINLVAVIRVYRVRNGLARRIVQLSALRHDGGGVAEIPLVAFSPGKDEHEHDEKAQAALVDTGERERRTAFIQRAVQAGSSRARTALATYQASGGRLA